MNTHNCERNQNINLQLYLRVKRVHKPTTLRPPGIGNNEAIKSRELDLEHIVDWAPWIWLYNEDYKSFGTSNRSIVVDYNQAFNTTIQSFEFCVNSRESKISFLESLCKFLFAGKPASDIRISLSEGFTAQSPERKIPVGVFISIAAPPRIEQVSGKL